MLFFFVHLGSNLNLAIIGDQVPSAFIFSAFVLIGNPLIVLIIMGLMGYRKRTSFLAGLTVAQISEFSLIFAGLGLAIGHINDEVLGLITLVGLITIGLSTYLILYSHQIYDFISPALVIFQRKDPYSEKHAELDRQAHFDLIIFGLGRFGTKVAEMLDVHHEISYFGIDFDPQVIKEWRNRGKVVIYGDMDDTEILDRIPFMNTRCVISTIPYQEPSIQLTKSLKSKGYKGKIFLTALHEKDYELLNNCGADEVLLPHQMAATNFYNSFLSGLFEKR